jgi:hypothetical protein
VGGAPAGCDQDLHRRPPAKLTAAAEQLQAAANPEAAEAEIEAVQAEAVAQVADARGGLAREAQRRQQAEADARDLPELSGTATRTRIVAAAAAFDIDDCSR